MIQNGDLMSFLAVNEHGQTAGHFALAFSDVFQGMPELSTVVTRKAFRGLGLFGKFIDHAETIAKEKGFRAIMGQPVAFHPISQKAFLRSGYTATSLLLSYIAGDVESEYNPQKDRLDLFACMKMMDKNAKATLYPPAEIADFVKKICDGAGLYTSINNTKQISTTTRVKINDNTALKMKRIILSEAGNDIDAVLADSVDDAVRRKHEMIELFISLRDPSCEAGYETAKHNRFVLSGILPGSENDDYLVMQLLLKNERRYDHLITVGEFEELTNDIQALAEKERLL